MPANSVIGALRAVLGLETAAFDEGVKQAQSTLGSLASKFKGPLLAISAAATGAVVGLGYAMKQAIDRADDMGKTAQKIGIPVEELSKLQYAASLADVEMSTLSTGIGKLSQAMADIAGGGSSDATRALDALNIEAQNADGTFKSTSQVFSEVAEKFAGMEDGAGKTAIAMAIFGRSGKELIPLLNAGAKGLADSAAEAERFGIVIDQQTAAASERFNDNLTRLQAAMGGIVTQITAHLAPGLADLSDKLVDYTNKGEAAKTISDGIKAVMQFVAKAVINTTAAFQEMSVWVKAVTDAMGILKTFNFKNLGDVAGKLKSTFSTAADDVRKVWEDAGNSIADVMSESVSRAAREPEQLAATVKKAAAPIIQSSEQIAAAAKSTRDSVREGLSSWNDLVEQGKSVFEATRTPAEQLTAKMQELNMLLNRGVIDWDTYNRAVAQAQDTFTGTGNLAEQIGGQISSSFSQAFDDLISGSFDAKEAVVDLLQSLAKLAVNNVFQSLIGGIGGGGKTGFLGSLFGGLKTAAHGGTFKVGGSGGVDSQIAALRVSPRELIEVRKPGDDFGGGSTVVFAPKIDARGADSAAIRRLEGKMQTMAKQMPRQTVHTVQREKQLNPGFVR